LVDFIPYFGFVKYLNAIADLIYFDKNSLIEICSYFVNNQKNILKILNKSPLKIPRLSIALLGYFGSFTLLDVKRAFIASSKQLIRLWAL